MPFHPLDSVFLSLLRKKQEMASLDHHDVLQIEDGRASDEKTGLGSPMDEKGPSVEVSTDEASFDAKDADEALELVGMRRTVQFSEEYNMKLRKKLVRVVSLSVFLSVKLFIRGVGLDYPTVVRSGVFHTVFVSKQG